MSTSEALEWKAPSGDELTSRSVMKKENVLRLRRALALAIEVFKTRFEQSRFILILSGVSSAHATRVMMIL